MKTPNVTALALAMTMIAAPGTSQNVINESYSAPDGSRVLRQSIEIPATVAAMWTAWTTTEGVRTWAAPVVSVDLRMNGIWESTYSLDGRIGNPGNIRNEFLAFLPLRMLAFRIVNAPPDFQHRAEASTLLTVVEMQDAGTGKVRVAVSMSGFGTGRAYDDLYAFFERGNGWTLEQLRKRFIDGPTDWKKVIAPGS